MTEIADPALGSAERRRRAGASRSRPTRCRRSRSSTSCSTRASAWTARVRRSRAGGREFTTGTALVDASTLGGVNLAALAAKRQTPVTGLDGYPVEHHEMAEPEDRRVLRRHGGAELAAQPDRPNRRRTCCRVTARQQPRRPGVAANYCVALFTLTDKDDLPTRALLSTITVDRAGRRRAGHGGLHGAAEPERLDRGRRGRDGAAGLRQPGRHSTSARSATARRPRATPGSRRSTPCRRDASTSRTPSSRRPARRSPATSTPASPVAWGFDDGGFIYRDRDGNPIYDPATMDGNGTTIPRRGRGELRLPLKSLGFSRSAMGAGKLDGRPDVVDQPFGEGRAVMIGHDAFYRSWKEGDERIVLNALLYPTHRGAAGRCGRQRRTQPRRVEPSAPPLREAELPAVKARPVRKARPTTRRPDPGRAQARRQAEAGGARREAAQGDAQALRYVSSGAHRDAGRPRGAHVDQRPQTRRVGAPGRRPPERRGVKILYARL